MTKIKHVRTADCVVAGYRVHKSAPNAIGSLLLGLHVDEAAPPSHWMDHTSGLAPVGVIGAFPMARRRELFAELQSLVVDVAEHPWSWAAEVAQAPQGGSRWNPTKDLSFVRRRPDRDPASCGYAQLEQPTPFDVADVLAGRLDESM